MPQKRNRFVEKVWPSKTGHAASTALIVLELSITSRITFNVSSNNCNEVLLVTLTLLWNAFRLDKNQLRSQFNVAIWGKIKQFVKILQRQIFITFFRPKALNMVLPLHPFLPGFVYSVTASKQCARCSWMIPIADLWVQSVKVALFSTSSSLRRNLRWFVLFTFNWTPHPPLADKLKILNVGIERNQLKWC